MMFEDSLNMSEFQMDSAELFSDSALGNFFTQDYELLNNTNNAMEEDSIDSKSAMEKDKEDVLGKIVVDLQILPQQEQQDQEEELKTAGIGITEDPFFAETSKAANLFQNEDKNINSLKKEQHQQDPTQSFIDEMEEYLQQFQHQQQEEDKAIGEEEAQKLLDALMKEESLIDEQTNLNSVSRLVDENGQEIIIVIANEEDQDEDYRNIPSTSSSSSIDEDFKPNDEEMEDEMDSSSSSSEDSDWSPAQDKRRSTKRANAGRHSKYGNQKEDKEDEKREAKKAGRGRSSSKSMYHGVKDKKERKKLQNVVAARRYRDKKKNEVFENEMEEEKLKAKNEKLKTKLAEIEGEVKTLKKLVVELGLVKKFKR